MAMSKNIVAMLGNIMIAILGGKMTIMDTLLGGLGAI